MLVLWRLVAVEGGYRASFSLEWDASWPELGDELGVSLRWHGSHFMSRSVFIHFLWSSTKWNQIYCTLWVQSLLVVRQLLHIWSAHATFAGSQSIDLFCVLILGILFKGLGKRLPAFFTSWNLPLLVVNRKIIFFRKCLGTSIIIRQPFLHPLYIGGIGSSLWLKRQIVIQRGGLCIRLRTNR